MTAGSSRTASYGLGWIALAAVILLATAVALIVLRGQEGPAVAPPLPPTPTPTATQPDDPGEDAPGDTEALDAQVRDIASTVERLRERSFETVPAPLFLSEAQIADRVDDILADYTDEDADLDRRLLAALGAMDPDDDLRELYRAALSEQVAGLYDPETGELIVVATPDGRSLGPLAQMTLVHELGHALLDQVIGLPDVDAADAEGDEDAAIASQAVVEGDATLLMLLYAQQELTTEEQFELLEEQQDAATQFGALDDLPHVVRRQLLFPYEEGLAFVTEVQRREGWEAVDDAFRDPPTTTLDIMDPDRFLRERTTARDVRDAPDPGEGWDHATTRSVGAAHLHFLFEAPGDDESRALEAARELAMTWTGGQVEVWTDGDATAVAVTIAGGERLCEAVGDWYERAFPDATVDHGDGTSYTADRQNAHLECAGDEARLGIAPDLETARTIAG